MKQKLIVYAGSYNPFHIGHKNIADKLADIFGKENILIAVGQNPQKDICNVDSNYIEQKTGYRCISYSIYLHELVIQLEATGYDVTLACGLRNNDDLNYQVTQMKFIKDLNGGKAIKTIFIKSDEEYSHISSSAIRAMNKFKEGSGNIYLV